MSGSACTASDTRREGDCPSQPSRHAGRRVVGFRSSRGVGKVIPGGSLSGLIRTGEGCYCGKPGARLRCFLFLRRTLALVLAALEVFPPGTTFEGSVMSESLERLARNQALFRDVNEQIEPIAGDNGTVEFLCECSNTDCVSTIELSVGEYERVRLSPTWFVTGRITTYPRSNGLFLGTTGMRLSRSQSTWSTWRRRILAPSWGVVGEAQSHELEEALRILYRLRVTWTERDDAPAGGLKAIESLIEEFEQKQES
jgi:hypothetical protein